MRKSLLLLLFFALFLPLVFLGCEGDDGATGPPGEQGEQGLPGEDATAALQLESCAICHTGEPRDGEAHQAVYDDYADGDDTFAITIDEVTSVDNGTVGFFNVTMNFTILENGQPFIDAAGFPSLDQKRYYTVQYDSATGLFDNPVSFSNPTPTGVDGQYTVTASGVPYAPEEDNALVYIYITRGLLSSHSHISLYSDRENQGQSFGDADTYVSAANVAGCEKCHGAPYAKHGYRMAAVSGLADFAACKVCHYDTREGGHEDWQVLVDDPQRWAELDTVPLTPAEEAQYAYTANIMNDVHMSHAMEFPYPQSMATCNTCHEGKLEDMVLIDENFVIETCKSCHPVNGGTDLPDADGDFTFDTVNNPKQAPALVGLLPSSIGAHSPPFATPCNSCHKDPADGGFAPVFSAIHTGYNDMIYDTAGTKYSDVITVAIDNASLDNNTLTIEFSAAGTLGTLDSENIVPTVLVGLYGYDSKHFYIGPHERFPDRTRYLEYDVDGVDDNPRFTTVTAAGGNWIVTADLSMWADKIADGTVKRAEIAVTPLLEDADGDPIALNAASRTFNLGDNAFQDNYFQGDAAIVRVEDGCNECHDALATTFHTNDPGRGGNIVVCRLCHITKSGGSHLEMQSRSIDSYVHAIHSFQAFDIGDIDFDDPFEAREYEFHTEEFVYPYFTIEACESCHNEGKFNVPNQAESLSGALSGSDVVEGRNIGNVPVYLTGPATRACGACHRTHAINEDDSVELSSLFSHWRTNGYLIEAVDPNNEEPEVLALIDEIFSSLI